MKDSLALDLQHILDFLAVLRENNHKIWMDTHKEDYHQARSILLDTAEVLIQYVGAWDPAIANLTPKQCTFRINRDIRFSKEKSPYKTHMSVFLAPSGRNSGYAGYYLHLEPTGKSLIGGGVYKPVASVLRKIRQEIDYQVDELLEILHRPSFRQFFGSLQGDKLKRIPQGYEASHPQAELLKLKSFLVTHPVADSTVTHEDFLSQVLTTFQVMVPLNRFLNRAIAS